MMFLKKKRKLISHFGNTHESLCQYSFLLKAWKIGSKKKKEMILHDSCSQGWRGKRGKWEVCSFSNHPGFLSIHHSNILELK